MAGRVAGDGLFAPFFIALAFAVGLGGVAIFGHDDLGDFELQDLAVFDAAKATVGAEADGFSGRQGAQQVVGEGEDFGAFVATGYDFVVVWMRWYWSVAMRKRRSSSTLGGFCLW